MDYLDADKVAEKKIREAEVEEQKRLATGMIIGPDGQEMMDDIFNDFLMEETKQVSALGPGSIELYVTNTYSRDVHNWFRYGIYIVLRQESSAITFQTGSGIFVWYLSKNRQP